MTQSEQAEVGKQRLTSEQAQFVFATPQAAKAKQPHTHTSSKASCGLRRRDHHRQPLGALTGNVFSGSTPGRFSHNTSQYLAW
mmetsp:Transcript_44115/g.70897  ORF Transcript_44115/g.70897 Transcript_44115/m.70897 type:complete len:83 (+) Transcript_44115:192-440(+)